ncbi:ribbon-helix-helix domain-containing protein [Dehalococcoidia bacterium]|nr:ribbon-helix-helix domain-containing protein [Dehalococcoidia bacterium]MCL0069765.1 ribbon-helix-helix domain-containing protein [Dehalococcoidia bacterium]
MGKKVIQVPVDEKLFTALDQLSRKQRRARSELIRQACERYLRQVESEELDRLYQKGYERLPEEPELGEAQIVLAGEILSK